MHQIMTELHQDHKHIARLLNILRKQLELMSSDGDPDLMLMTDIACYFQHYPDLVHHPKEDKVFEVFSERTDKAADIVEALRKEHQQLPAVTVEFHNMLDAALNDALFISRKELQQKIQAFIDIEIEHLKREEAVLFPLIEKTLTDEDWQELEQDIDKDADPLFGVEVDDCYDNLYQIIKSQESS